MDKMSSSDSLRDGTVIIGLLLKISALCKNDNLA